MITAEELFKTELDILKCEYPELEYNIRKKTIEFAKLHVKLALEDASKKAKFYSDSAWDFKEIEKNTINSYPLSNIK